MPRSITIVIKITFENMASGARLVFDFTNRPFIRTFSHCQLSREQTLYAANSDSPLRQLLPVEVLRPDHLDPSAGLVIYCVRLHLRTSQSTVTGLQDFQRGRNIAIFGQFGDTGSRMMALANTVNNRAEGDIKVGSYS